VRRRRRRGPRAAAAALLAVGLFGGAARAAEDGACLDGAETVAGSGVQDARSVVLADGRVLRLAGLEPFLFGDDPDGAELAVLKRLLALAAGRALTARLVSAEPDRYGRLPALIALGDALLQERLAREGLAIAFAGGDPMPCFDRILAAEAAARRERRGFWAKARVPAADPDQLGGHIGRFAIFEGVVVSVGNRRRRTYLNFGGWWKEDVTVEIDARDRERFGGEAALAELAGRRVRVRGFVEEKGGPMVAVRSPMQIEVIGRGDGLEGDAP